MVPWIISTSYWLHVCKVLVWMRCTVVISLYPHPKASFRQRLSKLWLLSKGIIIIFPPTPTASPPPSTHTCTSYLNWYTNAFLNYWLLPSNQCFYRQTASSLGDECEWSGGRSGGGRGMGIGQYSNNMQAISFTKPRTTLYIVLTATWLAWWQCQIWPPS